MNQLVSQVMGQQLRNSPIAQAYQTVKAASNTDEMLRYQLSKMPNGKEVLEAIDKCGGNYEAAVTQCLNDIGISMSDLANIMSNISI